MICNVKKKKSWETRHHEWGSTETADYRIRLTNISNIGIFEYRVKKNTFTIVKVIKCKIKGMIKKARDYYENYLNKTSKNLHLYRETYRVGHYLTIFGLYDGVKVICKSNMHSVETVLWSLNFDPFPG